MLKPRLWLDCDGWPPVLPSTPPNQIHSLPASEVSNRMLAYRIAVRISWKSTVFNLWNPRWQTCNAKARSQTKVVGWNPYSPQFAQPARTRILRRLYFILAASKRNNFHQDSELASILSGRQANGGSRPKPLKQDYGQTKVFGSR